MNSFLYSSALQFIANQFPCGITCGVETLEGLVYTHSQINHFTETQQCVESVHAIQLDFALAYDEVMLSAGNNKDIASGLYRAYVTLMEIPDTMI